MGTLRSEDFSRTLAEGASARLLDVSAFVSDEMRPLPDEPTVAYAHKLASFEPPIRSGVRMRSSGRAAEAAPRIV